MITFENGELEVALVTYNRCPFIKEWLKYNYVDLKKRNIYISIYDSSTDGMTEMFINENNEYYNEIDYVSIPSETEIGYKPMLPIFRSKAKYVWIVGDSRYHDFEELDTKVFPFIKQGLDCIIIDAQPNPQNDGIIYTDKSDFLRDCFISSTCIGLSIYKREMFDCIKNNVEWLKECDRKYRHNYGFGWLGYFYEAFADGNNKACVAVIEIKHILPREKIQTWTTKYYECWVENLCDIMDYLPAVYVTKDLVPKETWERMKQTSLYHCCMARIRGGLSPEIYEKYKNNGMLQRVTTDLNRVRFYAYAPMWIIKILQFYLRVILKVKAIIKKLLGR